MMEYPPLVRLGTLYPFIKVLQQAGCPIDRHLEKCRLLRQFQAGSPEQIVPLVNILGFLERASRCEGMEDLGFLAGSQCTLRDLGEFGKLVLREPTILKALKKSHQVSRSYNTSLVEWTVSEGAYLRCFRQFRLPSPIGLAQADHFALMMTLNSLRCFAESDWLPGEIAFQSRRPSSFDLESLIGVPVLCSQVASSISIPWSLLAREIEVGRRGTGEKVDDVFEPAPEDPIDAIRLVVEVQLYEGASNIQHCAEASGMSVRTLQRRLGEEGLSYSRLLDDVRFKQAISLLNDLHTKVIEIALELGYETPGSFTRAFRRWSGFSPQEYRVLIFGHRCDETDAHTAIQA